MNKKHIGSSFFDDVAEWEKSPTFRKAVEEHKERAMLAGLLKQIRVREEMTQTQLAQRAKVPQSVIARMESTTARTLPRLDVFKRIVGSVGYQTEITARKGRTALQVAL